MLKFQTWLKKLFVSQSNLPSAIKYSKYKASENADFCHGVKPLCFLYNACTFKKFNMFSLRLFDIQEIHLGCTFPMGYYIFQPDFKWLYSNWIFTGRYFLFFFRKTLNDSPLGNVICLLTHF